MAERGPLDGRVAIVTGAGRGIGRGEAVALAAAGAKVVVNDVGVRADGHGAAEGPADEVVEFIRSQGGEAVASYESVADWEGAGRVVATAVERFGRLDILVNNAGIVRQHKIEEVTEEDFDLTIDVNLKGTFAMCRSAIPVLRQYGGGRIVNTCSNQWAAPIGNPEYAASKGGVVSLTYELAWELHSDGITVNAIAPFALTRMTEDAQQRDAALVASGAMSARRAKAKEARADAGLVAPIVVYLASAAAAEVTGCVFRAGGGKIGIYSHPVETRTIFRDEQNGPWSHDELVDLLPRTVLANGSKAPHIL
ncbi:Short-chain dehydrogenase [Streptomyces hygroscopicus subsp. jinggangensis 5008]|nr:Short-chain dehydrogenase [Streptomyces hygroscopicus subsp. jinggangensis 5008]AGF60451.1 Short-chain dehydrogenase [Streptomyces hygroscopicus subsp. jinggangensis TL01]